VETANVEQAIYYFPGTNYAPLEFTNSSGVAKQYKVDVSFKDVVLMNTSGTFSSEMTSYTDAAIIKTDTSNADTVLFETIGGTYLNLNYKDLATSGIIALTEKVATSPSNHSTRPVFNNSYFERDRSMFKKVTLQPGEKVSLKFKLGAGDYSYVTQAQIFVNEL